MNVPTFVQGKPLDENGNWTKPWQQFFDQLLQKMQVNLSDEGFVIPSQTTADITIIQNNKNADGTYSALSGTLLFDSEAQAGLGQLKIRMNDNTFHPITNT